MRDGFEEYFDLSEADFKDLWSKAVFVFDTNALLSLFRDKKSTSDDLMNLIKSLKDRVWVPHQVAMEFHKNRTGVVIGNKKLYQPLRNAIDSAKKQAEEAIRKNMDGYKHHPVMSVSEAITYINRKFDRIISDIKKMEKKSPRDDHYKNVLDTLVNSLSHCTGSDYSSEDLEKIIADGKVSCEANMPPGYIDYKNKNDRPIEERLGDYILWRQMIDYAVSRNCPIIFVTDDVKEDWWREVKGEKVGPRLELVREFMNKTSQRFHAYTRYRFLEMAREHLNVSVKNETINDVRKATINKTEWSVNWKNKLRPRPLTLAERAMRVYQLNNGAMLSRHEVNDGAQTSMDGLSLLRSLENERDLAIKKYNRAIDYHRLSVISGDESSIKGASAERFEAMARVDRISSRIDDIKNRFGLLSNEDDEDDEDGEERTKDFME